MGKNRGLAWTSGRFCVYDLSKVLIYKKKVFADDRENGTVAA